MKTLIRPGDYAGSKPFTLTSAPELCQRREAGMIADFHTLSGIAESADRNEVKPQKLRYWWVT
jgi:hypothetical protein